MGGRDEAALKRAGRVADGYIAGSSGGAKAIVETVRAAWQEAGRRGEPVFKGANYFAFGEDAEAGRHYLRDYYAFQGVEAANNAASQRLTATAEQAREIIKIYEDAGFDEVFFWATVGNVDQVKQLADIIG
jgi:alkanesulfonate monooxygenase SsuD/methylene tetrahydromethanopterin reductase-like flavin-dependent oxidoreductase (luciferase family)